MGYRAAWPGVQRAVRAAVASGGGGGGGTDPNPLYSALDMAHVPFHNGAGAWGAQLAFQTAAPPTITSDVNVASGAELSAALAVNGRRATLTANITSGSAQGFDITDNEIVVPNGFLLANFVIGTFSPATENTTRLRITKASGDSIGGQVHELTMFGASAQDIIIDGLQLSADTSGNAIPVYIDCPTTSRHAYLRNQMISAIATYGYGCEHLLICGNSAYHDANATGDAGDWGFRISSPGASIFFQNEVRGNSYAPLRWHPRNGSALQYGWAAENRFVSLVEGRTFDCHDTAGTSGYPNNIDAIWMLNNTFYVDNDFVQLTQRNDASPAVDYFRINGNTVYGSAGTFGDGGAADGDVTGNTYNATLGTVPAWGAAGDPTGIDWTP